MSVLDRQIQTSNATEYNRYPHIFNEVAEIVRDTGAVRVLSFGCSTGEEIASLDAIYLSGCTLIGVDINEPALAAARSIKMSGRNECRFLEPKDVIGIQAFDVVLGMSVFCRWPEAKSLKDLNHLYSFDEFESQLCEVDELLVSGGILVLHNTNYYFEDTELFAKKFRVFRKEADIGFVARFDKSGKRYVNDRPGYVIFQKTCE